MTVKSSEWARGVRAAAAIASEYDRSSSHPYKLEDCILSKLNIRTGKPRRNTRRRETRERTLIQALGLALGAMSCGDYSEGVRAIARFVGIRTMAPFREAGCSRETCKELAKHLPRGGR